MSAIQATVPAGRTTSYKLSFGGVVRSEWIKVRTLRSTWWTLGVAAAVFVLFALMIAASSGYVVDETGTVPANYQAEATVVGYMFAQLAIAVFGALSITGEYSTGAIRSTYAAVPKRTPALVAKALIVLLVGAVVSVLTVGVTYLVTNPIFGSHGISVDFGDPDVWRVLGGVVLYLAAIGVFSLGVGTVLRNSTGAIFTLVAIIFVLPMVVQIAGYMANLKWLLNIGQFLPSEAGGRLFGMSTVSSYDGSHLLGPWQGFGVLVAWVVVFGIAAVVTTKRRDV